MFSGPHAYVSPTWYRTPGTVPTWNYAAVHAYGMCELIEGTDAIEVIRQRCGVLVPALLLTADRSPQVQAEAERSGLPPRRPGPD